MAAARERGQALHVHAEESSEGLGLRLAELRELGGHLLHGAVALAQLDAGGADVGLSLIHI